MRNRVGALILAIFSAGICQSAELFVPLDYPTIQAAVNAAQTGDRVIVADGTYSGDGNRNILIEKDLVVKSENGAKRCIVDCNGSEEDPAAGFLLGDPKSLPGISPVDKSVVIEGFTIQNGYYKSGGGISIEDDFIARIVNCRFVKNTAAYYEETSLSGLPLPPRIVRIDLLGIGSGAGGAILCNTRTTLANCIIEGNCAEKGGGICCRSGTTILHCTIVGNQAEQGGGIFYTATRSRDGEDITALLANSIVRDNWAEYGRQLALSYGGLKGGVTMYETTAVPFSVDRCVIQGGLKAVSFDDLHVAKAIDWNHVYEGDPYFYRDGQWNAVKGSDSLSWQCGDYRLLPFSGCIDRIEDDFVADDFAGHERPFDCFQGAWRIFYPGMTDSGIINLSASAVTLYDIGAYEASWQLLEGASVHIYPDMIIDDSTSVISGLIDDMPGETPERKCAFVKIQLPNERANWWLLDKKRYRLFTSSGLKPVWVYAFRMGRGNSDSICIAGIFDYSEFVKDVRATLPPLSRLYDVDVEHMLDFWIVSNKGLCLKTSGQIRYIRPGIDLRLKK